MLFSFLGSGSEYKLIFVNNAFYVVGGRIGVIGTTSSNIIGRLDAATKTWSDFGRLVNQRHQHNVIFDGTSLLVVGGEGNFNTEVCTLSSEGVLCSEQEPFLKYYSTYPELFLVSTGFCKF